MVGALAEGGADLDKARAGTTPLMMAAQFLLTADAAELGADHAAVGWVNVYEGKTALEAAEAAEGRGYDGLQRGGGGGGAWGWHHTRRDPPTRCSSAGPAIHTRPSLVELDDEDCRFARGHRHGHAAGPRWGLWLAGYVHGRKPW